MFSRSWLVWRKRVKLLRGWGEDRDSEDSRGEKLSGVGGQVHHIIPLLPTFPIIPQTAPERAGSKEPDRGSPPPTPGARRQ